jgi:hypothetical protein
MASLYNAGGYRTYTAEEIREAFKSRGKQIPNASPDGKLPPVVQVSPQLAFVNSPEKPDQYVRLTREPEDYWRCDCPWGQSDDRLCSHLRRFSELTSLKAIAAAKTS